MGDYSSLALDSNNKVHISYYNWAKESLKYATNTSGSWVIRTVEGIDSVTDDVGMYSSIAADSSDNVHIAYYDLTNGHLKYATNASGSWVTTTADRAADVGEFSSIAIGSDDKVHISYYDNDNGNLKYAVK